MLGEQLLQAHDRDLGHAVRERAECIVESHRA